MPKYLLLSLCLLAVAAFTRDAHACSVNLIEGPIVDWSDGCGIEPMMRDIAEHDKAPNFKLEFDRNSFEAYYSNIKKITKIGDLGRDTQTPIEYCDRAFKLVLLDGSIDNWMYSLLAGAGNADPDIQYLAKKAHDEFFGKVTGMKCRMKPGAKQAELKLEDKTLVIELNPLKCDDTKGCRHSTSRPNSTNDDDFHPYNYYQWMVPFLSAHFPAFKTARDVCHKRYPQVAL